MSETVDTGKQHNAHMYAFYNAPLHEKPEWARAKIAKLRDELEHGEMRSADEYYVLKAQIHNLEAKFLRKKPHEHNPMGFWFGHQSN